MFLTISAPPLSFVVELPNIISRSLRLMLLDLAIVEAASASVVVITASAATRLTGDGAVGGETPGFVLKREN